MHGGAIFGQLLTLSRKLYKMRAIVTMECELETVLELLNGVISMTLNYPNPDFKVMPLFDAE